MIRLKRKEEMTRGQKLLCSWSERVRQLQPYSKTRGLWSGIVTSIIFSTVVVLSAIDPRTHILDEEVNLLFVYISNLILFCTMYQYSFWVLRTGYSYNRKNTLCLTGCLLIATLFSMGGYALEELVYGHNYNSFLLSIVISLVAAVLTFLITSLLANVTLHQRIAIENEHLRSENILNRYTTLQQQTRPHFLFNSLNTLDGLIGTNDEDAHKYLSQLAALYRYSMKKETLVTLKEELQFTHSFIYMMQIRYGSNLQVEEKIDERLMEMQLPIVGLQMLVENATKHNVISQRHPLTISIKSEGGDHPCIVVSNSIQPKSDNEDSSGIGLSNLAHRYQLLCGLDIDITDSEGVFTVRIPLVKNKE